MYNRNPKDWISFPFFFLFSFFCLFLLLHKDLSDHVCLFSVLYTVQSSFCQKMLNLLPKVHLAARADWLKLGQEHFRHTVLTRWGLRYCEANTKQQFRARLNVPDSYDVIQQHRQCHEMRIPRGWQNRWSLNLYWRLRLHSFCILNNLYDLIIWELQLWKQMMLKQDLIQSVHLPLFKTQERWTGHPAAHSA